MDNLDTFRIFLSRLVDPFVIMILFMLLLNFVNAYKKKFNSIKNNVILIACITIYIFSLPFLSTAIVNKWEQNVHKYQGTNLTIDHIVVLGCGHIEGSNIPLSNELSTCSLRRLIEAIFVQQSHKNASLIVTGGKAGKKYAHATIMAKVAKELGVSKRLIHEVKIGHTTEQEAKALTNIITGKNIILVTSAAHMRRAISTLAIAAPKNIVPAPTNFYGVPQQSITILSLVPNLNNLSIVSRYFHERVGQFYSWLSI